MSIYFESVVHASANDNANGQGFQLAATTTVNDDSWHMLTLTQDYSADQAKLYVDASLEVQEHEWPLNNLILVTQSPNPENYSPYLGGIWWCF